MDIKKQKLINKYMKASEEHITAIVDYRDLLKEALTSPLSSLEEYEVFTKQLGIQHKINKSKYHNFFKLEHQLQDMYDSEQASYHLFD